MKLHKGEAVSLLGQRIVDSLDQIVPQWQSLERQHRATSRLESMQALVNRILSRMGALSSVTPLTLLAPRAKITVPPAEDAHFWEHLVQQERAALKPLLEAIPIERISAALAEPQQPAPRTSMERARHLVSDPKGLTDHFALAPKTASLQQLAEVGGHALHGRASHQEAKAARWASTALKSVTFTGGIATSRSPCRTCVWLADQRLVAGKKTGLEDLCVPEVRRLPEVALPLPERGVRERLAWSDFRRRKRYRARVCHEHHRFWPGYAGPNPLDSSRSTYGSNARERKTLLYARRRKTA